MAEAKIYELNNGSMQVHVSNFGCTITSLFVPDKDGKLAGVVLGFNTLEPYLKGASPVTLGASWVEWQTGSSWEVYSKRC